MSILSEIRPNIGQELLNVPMGDMIRDMAFAIADAQMRLDEKSIEVTQMLGGLKQITQNGKVTYEDSRVFFGKEKIRIHDAIEIYNTSSDLEYKTRLLQMLGTDNYEYDTLEDFMSMKEFDKEISRLMRVPAFIDGGIYSVLENNEKLFFKYIGKSQAFVEVKYFNVPIRKKGNALEGDAIYVPNRVSMLELGFSPTFYQFVDTIIEVKISITYVSEKYEEVNKEETEDTKTEEPTLFRKTKNTVYTSIVNSHHSQKYSYATEGSSLLRTKLVPIPPPAILEERIRALMRVAEEERAFYIPLPENEVPEDPIEIRETKEFVGTPFTRVRLMPLELMRPLRKQ